MGTVKDEGSPSSSGLAMAGSKELLFSHLQSALTERGCKRERERRERGEGAKEREEREFVLVKYELLVWQLSLIGLF